MKALHPTVLREGYCFLEGPRAVAGGVYASDVYGQAVHFIGLDGTSKKLADVSGRPSGLGRLADGDWVVVSMNDNCLLRLRADGTLQRYADLSAHVHYGLNDLVVDAQGRCYLGSFGFDRARGELPRTTDLLRVDPDGTIRIVATDLWFPNGLAFTADGRLVVAESYAERVTCFDVHMDGSLSGRRVFANVRGGPDGICTDRAGGVWVSCFIGDAFVRVLEGGKITHRIDTPGRRAVACNLAGEDFRTLVCLTAETTVENLALERSISRVETVRVEDPGVPSP